MRQHIKLGFRILAAATSLGLAAPAFAQTRDTATAESAPGTTGWGQLGSGYSGLAFTYNHLASTSPSMERGFELDLNQPVRSGLDFNLAYDWGRSENYLERLTSHDLEAGLTAFAANDWGKPYIQALAGWMHEQGAGPSTSSFVYTVGTGIEFQVAQPFVLTPFVDFKRATAYNQNEFDYGVKAAYRLDRSWAVVGSLSYDAVQHASDRAGYSVGFQYHF